MTGGSFSGSVSSNGVHVDTGHPFLDRTVDGFLKIGTVGVAKAAAEEAYHMARQGSVSKHRLEHSLKKMCKEGAFWGSVAGLYIGAEYGVAKMRGTHDWKNAMVGGALAGAIITAATKSSTDKIVTNAIAGGAIATASAVLNYFSY